MEKKKLVLLKAIIILAIIAVAGGIYVAIVNKTAPTKEPLIGGDKDAHGCLGPAGYSWCEVKQKCLRVWEEKCEAGNVTSTTPKTGSVSVPTAWKTYSSNKFGFSFEYPTLSKVTIASSSSSVAETIVVKLKDSNISYLGNGKAISFQVYDKGSFIPYTADSGCKLFAASAIAIDGKSMDIAEHESCRGEEGVISSTHYTHAIISLSDTQDIVFTASLGNLPFGKSDFVNVILKTFKFVPKA